MIRARPRHVPSWLEPGEASGRGFGPHVPGAGEAIAMFVVGIVLLVAILHLARGIGHPHGQLAKHLLVLRT